MARPHITLDYKTLDTLCKLQCTGEECASVLSIDYDTLNLGLKRDGHGGFTEYFKKIGEGGKASLRRLQWKSAESGNATMQIWLGKQYLGQTDKTDTNTALVGSLTTKASIDFSGLSDAALAEIAALAVKGDKNRND
jgi:hypothetical protein